MSTPTPPLHELAATPTPDPAEYTPPWAGARQSTCTRCGSTDNHPMKVVVQNVGQPDERVDEWHHDCHALATGDPHSVAVVEQSGGAKGHELRVFLFGDPDQGTGSSLVHPDHATAGNPAGQEA